MTNRDSIDKSTPKKANTTTNTDQNSAKPKPADLPRHHHDQELMAALKNLRTPQSQKTQAGAEQPNTQTSPTPTKTRPNPPTPAHTPGHHHNQGKAPKTIPTDPGTPPTPRQPKPPPKKVRVSKSTLQAQEQAQAQAKNQEPQQPSGIFQHLDQPYPRYNNTSNDCIHKQSNPVMDIEDSLFTKYEYSDDNYIGDTMDIVGGKTDETETKSKELSPKEASFLSHYIASGFTSVISAMKKAGYSAAHESYLYLLADRIFKKYEQYKSNKEILADLGLGPVYIALKLKDKIEKAKSESVQLKALELLAKCQGLLRETLDAIQGAEIIIRGSDAPPAQPYQHPQPGETDREAGQPSEAKPDSKPLRILK